jgi:hypothetical protein
MQLRQILSNNQTALLQAEHDWQANPPHFVRHLDVFNVTVPSTILWYWKVWVRRRKFRGCFRLSDMCASYDVVEQD